MARGLVRGMTAPPDLRADVERITPDVIALRRRLHQHPELAFEEVWTSATLAAGAARTVE